MLKWLWKESYCCGKATRIRKGLNIENVQFFWLPNGLVKRLVYIYATHLLNECVIEGKWTMDQNEVEEHIYYSSSLLHCIDAVLTLHSTVHSTYQSNLGCWGLNDGLNDGSMVCSVGWSGCRPWIGNAWILNQISFYSQRRAAQSSVNGHSDRIWSELDRQVTNWWG